MTAVLYLLVTLTACASPNKHMVLTEDDVTAAEYQWNRDFGNRLAYCEDKRPPEQIEPTEADEECFGPWYDADAELEAVLETIVYKLRIYWALRKAGARPDADLVAKEIEAILEGLPPLVRDYFRYVEARP